MTDLISGNKQRYLALLIVILIIVLSLSACRYSRNEQTASDPAGADQKEVHVAVNGSDTSGKGTPDAPFATASAAAKAEPGSLIIIHGGEYAPLEFGPECSGNEDSPTTIIAAKGEKVIVHAGDGTGIRLSDASYISVNGLETEGGKYGIDYRSTRKSGKRSLQGISIINCTVHGVRGVHGICVYAGNDLVPVTDLTVKGCEIYDCECGDSESLVLNGNIEGFLIEGNTVHDNNNIGIDMIGFEGTAKHIAEESNQNMYDSDFVRKGICRGNVVYNISTEGNPAYYEDGEYEPCAGGIYVDGGQDIDICSNFIFNCDIGLEVATEHNPDDNELFRVSGIRVHDNVITDCNGWTGLCFGGYDENRGFTEECVFDHNTLENNDVQIGIQKSKNNHIYSNLIIGGKTGVEFSEECKKSDMENEIRGNVCTEIEDAGSWKEEYGEVFTDRAQAANGFRSLIRGVGSRFIPDENMMEIYKNERVKRQ